MFGIVLQMQWNERDREGENVVVNNIFLQLCRVFSSEQYF